MQTLATIASSTAAGSEIVFSYVVATSPLADRAAALGEPWRSYFDPASLATDLRQLGFTPIEDLDADEANRRYCADRRDGLRVGGSGHLMRARVGKAVGG